MVLIGIAGKMGSGKDFITSKYIIPFIENKIKQKILQLCLADQIKVNVMTKNNFNYDELYIKKNDVTRKLLQVEGTEKGRNAYGENIWINYLANWMEIFSKRGIDNFVVTDVRFKNEMDFIKKNDGIMIKIDAPGRNHMRLFQESQNNQSIYNDLRYHPSECDLDDVNDDNFDIIIKNDNDDDINKSINDLEYTLISKFMLSI